jgi:carbon monoxide dehydrogenase subunit G
VKFAQSTTIAAPAEQVWQIVRDIPTAASCIPGAREIRATGDGGYQGSIRIRVGPISIEMEGTVSLKEEDAAAWRMTMEVEGSARRLGGGVRGSMGLQLEAPSQSQAELHVTADLTFLGRLGEMGQPLVKRKAEAMLQEFARNLSQRAGA